MSSIGRILLSIFSLAAVVYGFLYYWHAGIAGYRYQTFWFYSLMLINFIFILFFVYVFLRYRKKQSINMPVVSLWLFILLVANGLFVWGQVIENKLLRETYHRGQFVISNIEKFKDRNHRYPASLTEIEITGVELPQPAIKSSFFDYESTVDGYILSFPSLKSRNCKWKQFSKRWVCEK